MSELPKIARDRLQQQEANVHGKPLLHLDADLLTGFVERSISAKEREHVTAHLSVCAGCREVVAMSLPANEAGDIAEVAPAKSSQWKFMRFGIGTATAAVIISALVFFKVSEPSKPAEFASVTSQSTEKAKLQEPAKTGTTETRASNGSLTDGLAASSNGAVKSERPVRTKSVGTKVAAPATKDTKASVANEKHREDGALDRNARLMRPAISSSLPAARPMSPPAAAGNANYDPFGNRSGRNEITAEAKRSVGGAVLGGVAASGAGPAQPPSGGVRAMTASPDASQPVRTSSEMVQVQSQAAAVAQDSAPASMQQSQVVQAEKMPALGQAASALKKTKGGVGPGRSGMSAEDVASLRAAEAWAEPPSAATEASTSANLFAPPQPSYAWRIFDGKLQRAAISKQNQAWQDLRVASGVELDPRILSTSNASIHVASTDGTLYNSYDNGAQWQQVKNWTGEIVRLVFFRTELGVLETSTGEKWVTGDAGATWHKQQ